VKIGLPRLALLSFFFRIADHLATPGLAALARRESIYLDRRFSDHAPLIIDYDFKL
jgi:exodeoxyribonuclease-3